jgi:ABC-type uncharacterized transport system ATPase subunit
MKIITLWRILFAVSALIWTRKVEREMATVAEAIAAVGEAATTERAEVLTALGALKTEIQALKDQIANGTQVSDEQLTALLDSVNGILKPEDV